MFDQLDGATIFSTLDLKAGYHQIKGKENIKTAFICHWGLLEFVSRPFGLCNAPATFQCAKETVLHGLIGVACYVYLDGAVVYGVKPSEHEDYLRLVLECLQKNISL